MTIAPDDRGFTLGHGLFETLLWENHRLDHWSAHLDRLARGCKVLGMPPPERIACRNAIEAALIAAGGLPRAAVRLTWSAGAGGRGLDPPQRLQPVLSATAAALPRAVGPAALVTASVRRNDQSPASRLKTLAYLDNVLARAEARAAGGDEALMLNTRGEVACAAAANVFWVRDGIVCTPSLECGVLDGVMRGEVLATCARLGIPTEEVRSPLDHLAGAPMFITNSLVGLRAVGRLDGVVAPPSPLVATIARSISSTPR